MRFMYRVRRRTPSNRLLPEFRLIRTIRSPYQVVQDQLTGQYVLSSAAFKPTSDGLVSVDLEQLLDQDGLDPLAMYPALDRHVAAAAHTAGHVTSLGLTVCHDPTKKNWYHGGIGGKFTGKISRDLASGADFLIEIDQAEADRLFDRSAPAVRP